MTIRDAVRPSLFSLFLGVLATLLAVQALWLTHAVHDFLSRAPAARLAFEKSDVDGMALRLAFATGAIALMLLISAIVAVVRRGWVLRFIQVACICGYVVLVYAVSCATRAIGVYADTGLAFAGIPGEKVRIVYFFMQASVLKWILPAMAGFVVVHLVTARRRTINLYTGQSDEAPTMSDNILEDLRVGGKNPEYRKCWLMSLGTHAVAIFLIPLLLQMNGCRTRVQNPPPNAGDSPMPIPFKIVKARPKLKVPIYNMNSPIVILRPMDFTVSDVFQQLREATEVPYKADPTRFLVGRGRSNTQAQGGIWPGVSGSGKVRFVRISYNGDGWNDGIDDKQPSVNLLRELGRNYKDLKIDYREEVIPIKALGEYRKGYAPPFVYMTGDGRINLSESECRVLRQYLQDGGMLFADSGSPAYQQAFCSMISRVMPEDRFVKISDDDDIFRAPFVFLNGAPPIWPHGGDRAMGVRYKGRLCVFFHPGDLNDAWKTGRSGLAPEKAELAFQMGMNVMYYAFKNYAQVAARQRK